MTTPGRIGTLAVLALLGLSGMALGGEAAWKAAHDEGWKAYQEGRLDDAEKSLASAAKELRAFDPADPRIATTFDHLAWAYLSRGKVDEAEPMAKWALSSREKRLGRSIPTSPRA